MARTNKQTLQQPVFTVGGSFQALAIDHLASDQSSEEEETSETSTPLINTDHNITSPSSKSLKAKRTRKEKARKLNQLAISSSSTATTTTATTTTTTTTTPTPSIPSKKEDEILGSIHPIQKTDTPSDESIKLPTKSTQTSPEEKINPIQKTQPISLEYHQTVKNVKNLDQNNVQSNTNSNITNEIAAIASLSENQPKDSSPTAVTSPTNSTIHSAPLSASTTDLDDDELEESIEINRHHQPLLNGSVKGLQVQDVMSGDRSPEFQTSLTKEYTNQSNPETPATARPFPVQSIPNNRQKSSIHSPKSNSPTQGPTTSQFGADHTPGQKWQTVLTRVFWSLVMVAGFITLMALGHLYLIILIFIIQLLVFREVTNLFQVGYKASAKEQAKNQLLQQSEHHHSSPSNSISPSGSHHQFGTKEKKRIKDVGDKNRTNKIMSWYFFGVANYFLYGESIIYYFKHIAYIDDWYLIQFGRHHRFISLLLYLIGFLGFVTNLDRGHLRRQFGLFSWIHMSLLLIIVFGQFMVNNILEGLIWFWVPASLVIMNDVAAYVFGMLFGKHQLIKLSPKKTVEGFVGGFFATVIFGVLWGSLFMGWNYMICPVKELGMTAFSDVKCDPNPVFKWRSLQVADLLTPQIHPIFSPIIDRILSNRFIPNYIWWNPFQLHCLVLATFAGLVAPFGGFFASGFKRAFNVKDFGHTIPGHGGLTDRFDCQFIMGLFTYFYYSSLVKEDENLTSLNKLNFTVGSIMEIVSTSLNNQQQIELFVNLKNLLDSKGLL